MPCQYYLSSVHIATNMSTWSSTAHRSGVTLATVSLTRRAGIFGGETSFIGGLSATFRTGAAHAMQRGAVVQNVAALHVTLGKPQPLSRLDSQIGASVSEQVATLRRLLFGFEPIETETGRWFKKAIEGGNVINPTKVNSLTDKSCSKWYP